MNCDTRTSTPKTRRIRRPSPALWRCQVVPAMAVPIIRVRTDPSFSLIARSHAETNPIRNWFLEELARPTPDAGTDCEGIDVPFDVSPGCLLRQLF